DSIRGSSTGYACCRSSTLHACVVCLLPTHPITTGERVHGVGRGQKGQELVPRVLLHQHAREHGGVGHLRCRTPYCQLEQVTPAFTRDSCACAVVRVGFEVYATFGPLVPKPT